MRSDLICLAHVATLLEEAKSIPGHATEKHNAWQRFIPDVANKQTLLDLMAQQLIGLIDEIQNQVAMGQEWSR